MPDASGEIKVKRLRIEALVQHDGRLDMRLKFNDFATQYVPALPEELLQRLADIYKEVYEHARKANRNKVSEVGEG